MGINFKNVSYTYKGMTKKDDYKALNNINLNVNSENEFITVCGKTGSGKSTLIQHMNALLIPTFGELIIFDKKIFTKKYKNKKLNDVRRKVGLVFQFPEYQLFEDTVLKDVMFGPVNLGVKKEEALVKAKEALALVGLDEKFYNKSPLNLSGGEMRKVAIAGILSLDTKILVLDEPTRGLDPLSQKEIMEIFYSIHKKYNKTIVLITHDMDIIYKYSSRVIVMDKNEIAFNGNKNELFNNNLFLKYNLEEPEILKIINHINNNLNLNINNNINDETKLIEVLNEVKNG